MKIISSPVNTQWNGEPHWNVDGIVAELRRLRSKSLEARHKSGRLVAMPSRKSLVAIVDGFSAALFPNRLGRGQLGAEGVDYFVGNTLDLTLRDLLEQVRRELHETSTEARQADAIHDRAVEITRNFAAELPRVRALLDSDIRAAFEGDPAARSVDEVLVCYPGVAAMVHYRLAHELFRFGAPLLARIIAEIAHSTTGIDIHPGATIGESFFVDHGTGVVIGETAIIGRHVRLYQAVTLGAKRFPTDEEGVLLKGNARHPIVEDEVVIYAGATILGRITIGRGSVIGGNVWLTRSVPPGSTVSQAKVQTEAFGDGTGI